MRVALKNWYQSGIAGRTSAMGAATDAVTLRGGIFKLSDTDIVNILGCCGYSIMGDQNGYVSGQSAGNYEYVIVRNYTALWTYGSLVANSITQLTFQDYRVSDNKLLVTWVIDCGFWVLCFLRLLCLRFS